jgi:hypothetical protein
MMAVVAALVVVVVVRVSNVRGTLRVCGVIRVVVV